MRFLLSSALFASFAGLVASEVDVILGPQTVLSDGHAPVHPVGNAWSLAQIEDQFGSSFDPVEVYRHLDPAGAKDFDEPRLLRIWGKHASDEEAEWMTEGDKLRLHSLGFKFTDLTGTEGWAEKAALNQQSTEEWPELSYHSKVKDVISHLSAHNLYDNLEKLSSFHNRYYRSDYGAQSSHWIYLQILDIVLKAPYTVPISVRKFTHSRWVQPSIIARFEPLTTSPNRTAAVIIGAHQDSANYRFPLASAPGADDDGSGTVTILEAFRALVERGFTPEYPVEFHWYAAEEGGLLGSKEVVAEYVKLGREVRAMIQFDMTAYVKPTTTAPAVTFITTDVTSSLTEYVFDLAKSYVSESKPVKGAKLFPGAGSDHMSWYRAGFPGVFATEGDPMGGEFDPYIHTVNDTMNPPSGRLDFEHAVEFAKVAVGFAVELGEWRDPKE